MTLDGPSATRQCDKITIERDIGTDPFNSSFDVVRHPWPSGLPPLPPRWRRLGIHGSLVWKLHEVQGAAKRLGCP